MKKMVFLTGTRADFGKMKALMRYIENHPDIELHVVVTGMHMLKAYGSTYYEVERENYEHVYLIPNQHYDEPMGSIFGNTVSLLSRTFEEIAPDVIVIHGDRLEALAGATVGALNNRLVCHIEGGELSGTVDDLIRHSVTKLSHIHLVSNQRAKSRLIQMGESDHAIHIIGSPDLDIMASTDLPTIEEAKSHYSVPFNEYAISLFHPVTTEVSSFREYAKNYFAALRESADNFVTIYPNNDTGTTAILNEIEQLAGNVKFMAFPSIRFEYFLTLLKHSTYIIGNSSAGIREAPFYGVPTVNVGTRQNKRDFGSSIFNCSYKRDDIVDAIIDLKSKSSFCRTNSFGDGDSVAKFIAIVESDGFWNTKVQKIFVDLK
ncbi:MAG TPA: UDP-N-acetylglucosamine 2-epimerase (hydrolyzing) [Advenella kashmirensis]|uniref:UDP-N-acetylglucosamine 2-epimerase (Hydrolyzing) n=1 Tax=Advenella kashmirensis TaxID=310575 RepID=A0A356LCZ1_9BURK|nr:UDP-N-acetylglucosamine 2-epimerase (hydrolyzing) [Advenella kashmirensis]